MGTLDCETMADPYDQKLTPNLSSRVDHHISPAWIIQARSAANTSRTLRLQQKTNRLSIRTELSG
jgi:hypothetical protein